MQESSKNLSDIPREVEPPEKECDYPQLLCFIPQCRHWICLDDPYPCDSGRCGLEHTEIHEKTWTICSDGVVRQTAQWPQFECSGFEWHDQYDRQNDTWVAVAEVDARTIDGLTVARFVRQFRLARGQPVEDWMRDI